ncbi:SC5A9-like protein [Mya arenaria]|uniref:SC5A9-like protein n=2 Tax=Mya arenaria TaxID=6604 RepID=A0ABY7DRF8_MYAAR|nr:SC5A9-like protein [Mya arenaria]
MVVVSLFTQPRPENKLFRVTWWTRHAVPEPELTDDENETEATHPGQMEIQEPTQNDEASSRFSCTNLSRYMRNWLCGTSDQPEKYISPEEKAEIRRKLTSLEHNSKWGRVLNVSAVALATATAFLLGYFG